MWVWGVLICDVLDWGFQMIEIGFLNLSGQFSIKFIGVCGFMDDYVLICFLNRCFDGFDIQRNQSFQVDDFGVDVCFCGCCQGDMNYCVVGQNCQVGVCLCNCGFVQWCGVIFVIDVI